MKDRIEVLVVEDSPALRLHLVNIIESDPCLHVLGDVGSGEAALEFLEIHKPDVVVMDILMPGIDGYETTRLVMESVPTPIIICSSTTDSEHAASNFKAMEAGALAFVAKPVGLGHPAFGQQAKELVTTIKLMSEVKVVRRWTRLRTARSSLATSPPVTGIQIIAIGASTGGPQALQTLLTGLPKELAVPVLIVQHIATGFLPGFVEWLNQTTGFPTGIAADGESVRGGRAYLAPDGFHMGVDRNGQIVLSQGPPEAGLKPAISHLFRSVASSVGAHTAAVLLSGMGKDGASELLHLRQLGAVTIAQDAASSIVHGMPGEAIKLGAADFILPPDKIATVLSGLMAQNPGTIDKSIPNGNRK